MYILGIETSCDETAASVVKDGRVICSNIIASSLKHHRKYGGIVPEIASRMHIESVAFVVDAALGQAHLRLKDIDLIALTQEPGLKGSLLVGSCFAQALALGLGLPCIGINHLHAHIYAAFLQPLRGVSPSRPRRRTVQLGPSLLKTPVDKIRDRLPIFPFTALVVSGGHTSLFYVKNFRDIQLIGTTIDDACGEAFDKVGRILGLDYPSGPLIERLARQANPQAIRFACSRTAQPLDFSFSGIKTAVFYYIRNNLDPRFSVLNPGNKRTSGFRHSASKSNNIAKIADIAAAFQETVIDTLIKKAIAACKKKRTGTLIVAGGVAANNRLREKFYEAAGLQGIKIYFPDRVLCTDNAAMVAGLAYHLSVSRRWRQ
jgi:N6-L-threonylcarbamoyladenine synthase